MWGEPSGSGVAEIEKSKNESDNVQIFWDPNADTT